jgi:hypothetical protein
MLELLQVLNPTARECSSDNPMSAMHQSISSSMVCSAAQHGQLDCLRFLTAAAVVGTASSTHHHIPERDRCAVSSSAAAGGDVPTLQWLQQQGFLQEAAAPQPGLCAIAAVHGRRDAAVWLHEQGFKLGPQACTGAVRAGNLELLQWLHSCGARWEAAEIAVAAAAGGSVAVLHFLHSDKALGQHWDSTALTRLLRVAGRHGQLAAAQWLYSLGGALPACMWDVDVCWLHSGTLRWAVEQGVPWGESPPENTCYWLMNNLSKKAWEWAHEHGCPCSCSDASPIYVDDY